MVPLGLLSVRPMAQALRLPFEYYIIMHTWVECMHEQSHIIAHIVVPKRCKEGEESFFFGAATCGDFSLISLLQSEATTHRFQLARCMAWIAHVQQDEL